MQKLICFFLIFFLFSFISANDENLITRKFSFKIPDNNEKFVSIENLRNERIYNGNIAHDYEFPFVGDAKTTWQYGRESICTGSLIKEDWFITARSCIVAPSEIGTMFTVYFGSASRSASRTFNYGESAIYKDGVGGNPHPDYALIKLGIRMTQTETIKPILLPSRAQSNQIFPFPSYPVKIAGWGYLNPGGTATSNLRYGQFINTSPAECDSVFVDRYHFCSKSVAQARIQVGDVGGPVVYNYNGTPILIGVVSYFDFDVSINTNIGLFMEFITTTTGIEWRY